jgi:predicted flap endonuclease-1-like 5' DNA nuclease
MDFLAQLFEGIDQQESVFFLAFLMGAFLIGFIIAWIMWGGRANRARREAKEAQAQFNSLRAEYDSFKEEYALKEADLQKARLDVEEHKRQSEEMAREKEAMSRELNVAVADRDQLQQSIQSYTNTIEDLNDQILGLKTKNTQLLREIEAEEGDLQNLHSMQDGMRATLDRLTNVEQKVANLEAENKRLRSLGAAAGTSEQPVFEIDEGKDDQPDANLELVRDGEQEAAIDYVRAAIGRTIPEASDDDADDLTLINGIGSFIQGQLNELGLYTFEQLSEMDAPFVEQLTKAIAFFPGRIEKDDWAGQAERLNIIQEDDPEALQQVTFPNDPYDLKIVEGIGPKIEELLKNADINEWKDLAETSVDRLQEILAEAGDRFRLHDPMTWPDQARLAVAGEWEPLKQLQEQLRQ